MRTECRWIPLACCLVLTCTALPTARSQAADGSGAYHATRPDQEPGSLTGTTAAGNETLAGSNLVDLNTETANQLRSLPDVAQPRVDAIIRNRPYKSKEELLQRGIMPRSEFDEIKDRLVVR